MIAVSFRRVKSDQVERLRSWMCEVNERAAEVRETFVQETVERELAYLIEGRDGPILVYVIEARDLATMQRTVRENPFPIDVEHREIMSTVVEGAAEVETLLDISAG
jgi:hypothetical protein